MPFNIFLSFRKNGVFELECKKRKHLFNSEQNLRFSSAFLNILKCTPKVICSCVVMHVRRDRYDVV